MAKGNIMLKKHQALGIIIISCLMNLLSGCYHYKPPYNQFEPAPPIMVHNTHGRWNFATIFRNKKKILIKKLNTADIQYIEYGNTNTLIIPTDRYFEFNSPRLNELCYEALNNMLLLLKYHPCSDFYVAAFTDDIGSTKHQQLLTQARAETLVTYLWANGVKSARLHAEGYGSKYPVSQNQLIHGSAQNRRIELQWLNIRYCPNHPKFAPIAMTK